MAEHRILAEFEWSRRAEVHRGRVADFLATHPVTTPGGTRHPVWGFLFTYYSLRRRQLEVWHPGYGTTLGGARSRRYLERAGYRTTTGGVTVGEDFLQSRLGTVGFIADLLRSTASRAPRLGCFGMHEWAMVYRAPDVRHSGVPLRLGRAGTDDVVESMPLRCSHFDAFRFFTTPAMARNEGHPTRERQREWEQPGCLHANMDLYKWCYKLGPLVNSELLLDCLDLAATARALDMQASPYDLTQYDMQPVPVEEPTGRAEYVRRQSLIAERAAPLRTALLRHCEGLLATHAVGARVGAG